MFKQDSRKLTDNVMGWIARQGQVAGLDLVDLNYPQHFEGLKLSQVGSGQQSWHNNNWASPQSLPAAEDLHCEVQDRPAQKLQLCPPAVHAVCLSRKSSYTFLVCPHTTHN